MSNILRRADQIVNHRSEEKERQYGPFAACMERAALIYNAMSPDHEQLSDLAMYRVLIALKLSREAYAHKEDNLLDAIAYMGAMNHCLEHSWPDFDSKPETEVTIPAAVIEAKVAEAFEATGLASHARNNCPPLTHTLQEAMKQIADTLKNITL